MSDRGVLFVGNFLSASRPHRHYCEDLADRIELRGWEVVRTSHHDGRARRLFDMLGVTWSRRDDYVVGHVDVFSGPAFMWAEAVCFELRRLGKPVVVTLRGGNLPEFARRWPRRVGRFLRAATIVTSPSDYLRDAMSELDVDTVVVPNALEIARYPFQLRGRASERLIWVRAFHAIYNPVLAVEVLARLSSASTLTMVGADRGDGSLAAVRHRARELGVGDRLRIVPGVAKLEVPRYLGEGDVFLNTADVDNSPISVLEAMACGMCVVSTDVGGIRHLIRHERDALLVPARDPKAMAAAVERLHSEPALVASLSAAGRARAVDCDWAPVLDRWVHLFEQAALRA